MVRSSLCMLIFSAVAGCSASHTGVNLGGEEGKQIASIIEELNEVKHSAKKVESFFVSKDGLPPAKRLNQYTYYVAGQPSISGSNASCKVMIELASGKPMGDQEWTFEKVADRWKIKSAPMPQ